MPEDSATLPRPGTIVNLSDPSFAVRDGRLKYHRESDRYLVGEGLSGPIAAIMC